MRLLLDTHVVLWAAADPERLGPSLSLVAEAEQRLVSAASTWELAIKANLGKIELGMDVRSWVARALRALRAESLVITGDHAAAVEHLPPLHRDPFDRMLVAQATFEGVVLLTSDDVLTGYGDVVRLVSIE